MFFDENKSFSSFSSSDESNNKKKRTSDTIRKEDLYNEDVLAKFNNEESSTRNSELPSVDSAFEKANVHFKPSVGGTSFQKKEYSAPAVLNTESGIAKTYGLPDSGAWHVPLTFIDVVANKRKAEEQQIKHVERHAKQIQRESESIKNRTIKERERLKRMKNQSSHSTWKSEEFMKQRQFFDS